MPPNPQNLKPFVKGDPRIWRGGRPKSFPALQELAQAIAHETAKSQGSAVVIEDDKGQKHSVTVAEAVLRQWFQSKDFQKQRAAMEIAFGKVPTPIDITSKGERITGYAGVNPDDWDGKSDDASDAGA